MAKVTYTATFADGNTVEIATTRKATVAYKLTTPSGVHYGVSVSANAAQQSLNDCRLYWVSKQDVSAAAEKARAENAAYRAQCKIEIVPVQ